MEAVLDGFHLVGIGSHVGRQVTTVELHTFYYFRVGFSGLGFFYGDNAVSGNLFHSVSDQSTDHFVAGGNSTNAGDVFLTVYCLGVGSQSSYSLVNGLLDTLADNHGVGTGGNVLHAFVYKCLCQQGSGGSTVTGCVVGLGSYFTDQLCAHVFSSVFQFDFLRDGNTVIGDQGSTILLIQNHVPTLGTHGDLYSICQLVNTGDQRISCVDSVLDILCHNAFLLISVWGTFFLDGNFWDDFVKRISGFPQVPFKTFYLGGFELRLCRSGCDAILYVQICLVQTVFVQRLRVFCELHRIRASHWSGLNSGAVKHLLGFSVMQNRPERGFVCT